MYEYGNGPRYAVPYVPGEQPPLAKGYNFSTDGSVTFKEIAQLYEAVYPDEHLPEAELQDGAEQFVDIGNDVAIFGVRTDSGQLVGLGYLIYTNENGWLTDFAVHPDHRRHGIGLAILQEQLRVADGLGVPILYTAIEMTNTLFDHYPRFGFRKTGEYAKSKGKVTMFERQHPAGG